MIDLTNNERPYGLLSRDANRERDDLRIPLGPEWEVRALSGEDAEFSTYSFWLDGQFVGNLGTDGRAYGAKWLTEENAIFVKDKIEYWAALHGRFTEEERALLNAMVDRYRKVGEYQRRTEMTKAIPLGWIAPYYDEEGCRDVMCDLRVKSGDDGYLPFALCEESSGFRTELTIEQAMALIDALQCAVKDYEDRQRPPTSSYAIRAMKEAK